MAPPNPFAEILIVEDNPGDVRLLEEMLSEGGWNPTVHIVGDGDEAIEFLTASGDDGDASNPDVVFLDLHLPRMDGAEFLDAMDEELQDVPVVVLTGSLAGSDPKLGAIERNVEAVVEKPLEPDTFEALARSLRD